MQQLNFRIDLMHCSDFIWKKKAQYVFLKTLVPKTRPYLRLQISRMYAHTLKKYTLKVVQHCHKLNPTYLTTEANEHSLAVSIQEP